MLSILKAVICSLRSEGLSTAEIQSIVKWAITDIIPETKSMEEKVELLSDHPDGMPDMMDIFVRERKSL